jgi:hypothetical protein
MACQSAVVVKNEGAAYQEQHELSRHTSFFVQNWGDLRRRRHVCPGCLSPSDVFEWRRTFRDIVASLNVRNESRCVDDGRLGKEMISEHLKALDPSILEGRVREVGFETRGHEETEMGTRRKTRIWESAEADGGGWVR